MTILPTAKPGYSFLTFSCYFSDFNGETPSPPIVTAALLHLDEECVQIYEQINECGIPGKL